MTATVGDAMQETALAAATQKNKFAQRKET